MKQTAALKKIHEEALKRADEAWGFERENVRKGREDQKFYAGDQWDENAKKWRGPDRPMLTVNRLGTFVRQVTGDLRQNPPATAVLPSGGKSSQDKADVLKGMVRSIEAESDATYSYVKAGMNVAQAGQGGWRIESYYEEDGSFDQCLRISPIPDPFAILIDPFCKRPDKSDRAYCFVLDNTSEDEYKARWPDAEPFDFDAINADPSGNRFQWARDKKIRIAEYWTREVNKKTIYLLDDGKVVEKLEDGATARRERTVEQATIVQYILSGREVLEGPNIWPGKLMPVVFVPGEETTIDGATDRKGMVRDAKDPQRLLNYARTTQAEVTALQPKAPFIATVDQIKGYEREWQASGTKPQSILHYNFNPAMGPNQAPQRSQPPVMSPALTELSVTSGEDLNHVTGIYPNSLGAKDNATSGVAIRARQHEGDTGSNYISDNLKRGIAYSGRVLIDAIPHFYDSERIVRMLKESGEHEMAVINADDPNAAPENPDIKMVVDSLADSGKYDVVVSTGPSYLTRQQEMADTIVELSRNVPIVGQAAPDLLVKALNFPGGDEIAERIKKMLPPGLTEDGPMQPPPPNPVDVATAADKAASADLKNAQRDKTLLEADQLALQIQTMGADIQQLTQLVTQVASGQMPMQGQAQPAPPPVDPRQQQMDDRKFELENRKIDLEHAKIGKAARDGFFTGKGGAAPADAGSEGELVDMDGGPEAIQQPADPVSEMSGAIAQQGAQTQQGLAQMGQAIGDGMKALAGAIEKMAEGQAQLGRVMTAPRKATRDANGRVSGIEIDMKD